MTGVGRAPYATLDGAPLSITAAGAMTINREKGLLLCADGSTVSVGDIITIDGAHGDVYRGSIHTTPAGADADYQTLLRWADKYGRMRYLYSF